MSCKFSCSLQYSKLVKGNEMVSLYSEAGDVYRVKYKSSERRDLLLTVEWTVPKRVLVTVELYCAKFMKCFSSLGTTANGKRVSLKVDNVFRFPTDYTILCLISVIPYIKPKNADMIKGTNNSLKAVPAVHSESSGLALDESKRLPSSHIENTVVSNLNTELEVHQSVESNSVLLQRVSIQECEFQGLPMDKHDGHASGNACGAVITETDMAAHEASSSTISTKVAKCELQELTEEEHIMSDDVDDALTLSEREVKAHKIPLYDVSTKTVPGMESELQTLPTDNVSTSGHIKDGLITDKDMGVHNTGISNVVSAKSLRMMKADLQGLTLSNHNLISEDVIDAVNNEGNTEVRKIQNTVASSSAHMNSGEIESELQGTLNNKEKLHIPYHVYAPVINNTDIQINNRMPSVFFSEKTELVSRTLVQELAIHSSELESANENDAVVSSTEVKAQKSVLNVLEKNYPIMEKDFYSLSMDMLDLLKSGEMADAVISNGNMEVKAHKAIISARFPILRKQFTSPTGENMENRAIVDIPDDLLEDVLLFMYVGLVNIKNIKMAHDLHEIAQKYENEDLRQICSKHSLTLTIDNVLDTLPLISAKDNSVKHFVLDFIVKNFSALKNDDRMREIIKENPNLVLEILSHALEKTSSDSS